MEKGDMALAVGSDLVFDKTEPRTITEVIEGIINESTEEMGVRYIYSDKEEEIQSYRQLSESAMKLLGGLQAKGFQPQDKVILEIDDSKNFFTAFWGCLLGGIIPAPVSRPVSYSSGDRNLQKIEQIWLRMQRPVIITDKKGYSKYEELRENFNYSIISVDELLAKNAKGEIYEAKPDDIAFLQFSSGSTGEPKGVILSHANIIANVKAISKWIHMNENDITCSWLPHTHDMGLVGMHLVSLYSGITQIKMLPKVFIVNPLLFLKTIHKYGVTICAMPNFGLSWLVEQIDEKRLNALNIDLRSIRLLFNGAEPISVKVINDFYQKYTKYGFCEKAMFPVYGLAEASLAVSFPPVGSDLVIHQLDGEQSSLYVDEGYPIDGVSIRIVDEEDHLVEEGVVGHIQIKGKNVTHGYYNNDQANKDLFCGDWLRTGDMGFIKNRRLTVTGRRKDIIFVRGQNFYAHDIEEVIYNKIQGFRRGTVAVSATYDFSKGEDSICVFVKYKKPLAGFVDIYHSIKNCLQKELGLEIAHVIPVTEIPQTTSGKLQRFLLREKFINGEYSDVINKIKKEADQRRTRQRILPRNQVEKRILALWSDVLGIPEEEISTDDSLFELGGNSLQAVRLLSALEEEYGCELEHEVLLENPTIKGLGSFIANIRNYSSKPAPKTEEYKERAKSQDDIGIIGMALRFSGAKDPDSFWENLTEGKCLITSPPKQRIESFPNWADYAGFIDDIDKFDAQFFRISDEEAKYIDPQQRLFLQLCYEALERGGLITKLKENSKIGVYVAVSQNSYQEILWEFLRRNENAEISPMAMVGNLLNMIAARVSQVFNLKGPALAIDTACSSSLLALDYAIKDLRAGKIDFALVGAANLLLTPTSFYLSRKAGILSDDNTCRVFDAKANGTVLGEGIGVILLQPLQEAQKDNRFIHAIIKGIGVNNDGRSLGIMAPNPKGQLQVMKEAYTDAGIDPSTVTYIEAHGTGTLIGDPVEVKALTQFFSRFTEQKGYCGIGSVKSNIGHLLAAAGLAGLIKTVLCLEHKALVPTLGIEKVNPALSFEKSPFYPVLELQEWELKGEKVRRAGVSSFGFGGTNAHVVLEEAPQDHGTEEEKCFSGDTLQIITVSGRTEESLEQNVSRLAEWITGQHKLADISYTKNVLREHFPYRKAYLASDANELKEFLLYHTGGNVKQISGSPQKNLPGVLFFFPGEGAQCIEMTSNLYQSFPVFRRYMDECFALFDADLKNESNFMLPAIFSVDYSLAKSWLELGIKPQYIAGYGVGKFAAACIADLIKLEDAANLVLSYSKHLSGRYEAGQKQMQVGEDGYDEIASVLDTANISSPFAFKLIPESGQTPQQKPLYFPGDLKAVADELQREGCQIIIQVGPGQIDELNGRGVKILASTGSKSGGDWETLLNSLGYLYVHGFSINWAALYGSNHKNSPSLPTYAFVEKSYWLR